MAEELDDLEFLLPSELLTDDDLITDFKIDRFNTGRVVDDFSCGFGDSSSFGFRSDLSSPVESVTGTTGTESDEDDFIADLTRKGLKLSSSPQSTLCGFKPGSGGGSPNSASGVCSPPVGKDVPEWDLLYAAAGEVARLQMIEGTASFYPPKQFGPPPTHGPGTVPQQNPGFYPNQSPRQTHLSYQQFQAAKFREMKQHQMMNSEAWEQGQLQNRRRNGEGVKGHQGLSLSAWPTLHQSHHHHQQQHRPGTGMRAVFLGETGAKKERIGTGVFMPRRFGSNPTESRKKPAGCSTVLLPDRVVHALNLNMDPIESQVQHRGNGSFTREYDAALKHGSNVTMAQQGRNIRPQPLTNQEFRLPQEWTY